MNILSNEDIDFVKTATKKQLSSLTVTIILCCNSLLKSQDIVIQKSDNDNYVVFVEKLDI